MHNERLTMSVEEAARVLGIGRSSCYEAVARGEIRSVRVGRRRLIPRWVIDEMLRATSGPESNGNGQGRIGPVQTESRKS